MLKGGSPTIYVTDMDRAVEFYVNTLGLELKSRYGSHWASVDAGDGLILGLHPASQHSPKPGAGGAITVGFGLEKPIEEVVAELSRRGVHFDGPITGDEKTDIRLAFFSDPDGNPLYLCQTAQRW